MRRGALTLFGVVLVLLGGCALFDSGVLYEETWSDPNTKSWLLGDTEAATKRIDEGRYHVTVKQKTTVRYMTTDAGPFGDAQYDVDMRHEAGTENLAAGGLLFRFASSEHMYLFQVSPAGTFQIGKWVANTWATLTAWTTSAAINNGATENHLTVIADGTSLTFLINGTEVADLADSSILAGYVGVAVSSYSDAAIEESFDNLVVRELE